MSAHWVMLGLAVVTGWMGIVGARDLLRAKQRQLVPVRVQRPDDTQARRSSRY